MASPSSSENSTAQPFSAAPSTFKQKISVKLEKSNYCQWLQQVKGVLHGTKMVKYVVSPRIPERFLSIDDRESQIENLAYTVWVEQDVLLCMWLLSTVSDILLSRFVLLRHSWQVWEEIHEYCNAQMKTKSHQLRSELRLLSKGTLSITEFLVRVRTIVNTLVSIGDPFLLRDQVDLVLEALPTEYDPIVAAVNVKIDLPHLTNLNLSFLLRNHELTKRRRKSLTVY